MAGANVELKQIAIRIANHIEGNALELKRELLQVQLREKELQTTIHAASAASERSRNFVPLLGSDYQCPACWVDRERKSGLSPVDSPENNDIFVCRTCGLEFSFTP